MTNLIKLFPLLLLALFISGNINAQKLKKSNKQVVVKKK